MSSVDYSSVCTSKGDWSGEMDRVDEIIDAVGDRERGAGVEHKRSGGRVVRD
jgi:hypothetical protein